MGLAIIALVALKLMVWVDRAVDLTIADEARYLYQGVKLLEVGFPSPQWAPLYSIWYFLLNAVLPASGNIQLYYASFILLSTAIPLMLYGYLRRVAVAPIIALLAALFYLVSYSNLNIRPYPAKFAQFWVLIFLLASTFVPRRLHALLVMIALLTLGFIRPEYALSFVLSVALAAAIVLIKVWKQGLGALKGVWLQGLLVAGLAVALVVVLGNPLAGGRNLVAFKQHVALNYTATSDVDTNPWGNEDVIAKQLFGDFTSIPQAARNNPIAFVRHLWINARTYPVNLAQTMFEVYLPPRLAPRVIAGGVFALVIAGCVGLLAFCVFLNLRRRSALQAQGDSDTRVPRLPALHDRSNVDQIILVAVLLALVTVPVLVSSLLYHPRYHYLQVQGLLIEILGVLFVANTLKLYHWPPQRTVRSTAFPMIGVGVLALLLAPNLACGWNIFGEPRSPARTDVRNTVDAIATLGIDSPVAFLAYGASPSYSYDVYLGENFRKIPSGKKVGAFDQFLRKQGINMVIWPDKIMDDLKFQGDDLYKRFLVDPAAFGFQELIVPESKGQARVFVQDSLIAQRPAAGGEPTSPPAAGSGASPSSVATPSSAMDDTVVSAARAQAEALMKQRQYQEAAAIYRSLVASDPADRGSKLALATALAQSGQDDQALDLYQQVIDQWPEYPWAYMRRADLLAKDGKTDAALQDYRTATQVAPDNPDIHFAVANAYLRAGQREAAIAELEAGLKLDPSRQTAQKALQELQAGQP